MILLEDLGGIINIKHMFPGLNPTQKVSSEQPVFQPPDLERSTFVVGSVDTPTRSLRTLDDGSALRKRSETNLLLA